MYTKDSDFLDIVKTVFPDAHTMSGVSVKMITREKSTGVDLRNADFQGQILESVSLGTVDSFVNKSLNLTFECSYGKIEVSCMKSDNVFHPLELLELSNKPGALDLIMDLRARFNASVSYPKKIKEKINPYAVKKSIL